MKHDEKQLNCWCKDCNKTRSQLAKRVCDNPATTPLGLRAEWATICKPLQEIEHCDRCDEFEMELQDEK